MGKLTRQYWVLWYREEVGVGERQLRSRRKGRAQH